MVSLAAADKFEIMELQNIYAWGLDHKDASQFPLCLTEDIDARLTNLLQLTGRESFSAWLNAFHAPYDATQHVFSNFVIAADGDSAVMRSYVVARLYLEGHPGGSLFTSHGYYLDRVVRTEQGWRIQQKSVVNMWRTGNAELLAVGSEAVKAAGEQV